MKTGPIHTRKGPFNTRRTRSSATSGFDFSFPHWQKFFGMDHGSSNYCSESLTTDINGWTSRFSGLNLQLIVPLLLWARQICFWVENQSRLQLALDRSKSADKCQDGFMGGQFSSTYGNKKLGEGKLSTYTFVLISDSINFILHWMWNRQVPSKCRKNMQE